jgi:hypothetical protein
MLEEDGLSDIVHVKPLFFHKICTIFALFHAAPFRVALCVEYAVDLIAVDAAPALLAFVFRDLLNEADITSENRP